MRSKQIFETIVIQYDENIFEEKYTHDVRGIVAKIKIVKKLDPNYFIEVYIISGWIDWYDHFPPAQNVIPAKGLTTMIVT